MDIGTEKNNFGLPGEVFSFSEAGFAIVAADLTIPEWKSKKDPEEIAVSTGSGDTNEDLKFVTWGEDNKLPLQITELIYKDTVTASDIDLNVKVTYGDGIKPVKRIVENGKVRYEPIFEGPVYEFFENHDFFYSYFLEQLTDLTTFYSATPIINLTRDFKVDSIEHAEAAFIRRAPIDTDLGYSPYVLYSSMWGDSQQTPKDIQKVTLLNPKSPIKDMKQRLGIIPNADGITKKNEETFKYAVGIDFPSPGKIYYPKPYWFSIFDSGWFEFSTLIPAFKKAILKNQATIKYMIVIDRQYFENIFTNEGIAETAKQKARQKSEIDNIKKFLTGADKSGKAWITEGFRSYGQGGASVEIMSYVKIIALENHFKGGEYLEDSEESSNMISYAMGVHPSLRGSSPGKNKNINGTEARELFIIHNAMMKPFRDLLLRPFRIARMINGWGPDIDFLIPNIQLTTLDEGQGAKKVIGTNDESV